MPPQVAITKEFTRVCVRRRFRRFSTNPSISTLLCSSSTPTTQQQQQQQHKHKQESSSPYFQSTSRFFSTTQPRASQPPHSQQRASWSASSSSSPPETHYDLFPRTLPQGPPPRGAFAIDVRALRLEFLSLQARHHPDTQPAAKRGAAEAVSARLNDAYRTLGDPLLRAQYLLRLHGIDVGNDDSARVTAEDDAEVLTQVMETWEVIEAAEKEADLEAAKGANEARILVAEGELGGLFEKGDWDGAKREAVRLRYWRNVREALDNWGGSGKSAVQH